MLNRIDSVSGSNLTYSPKEKTTDSKKDSSEESGVILEIGKSKSESSPVYKVDRSEIQRLWNAANKSTQALRDLVQTAILRQEKTAEKVFSGEEILEIDAEAKAEAEKLISVDGEYGAKQTADRIMEFAKALSGGDKGKISELRDAIKQGFQEASDALGGLPDVSQKTYDEIMARLDQWEAQSE